MRSSQDSPDICMERELPVLLVAEAGVHTAAESGTDWFTDFDDLMVVVEALCPTWPDQDDSSAMRDMRL